MVDSETREAVEVASEMDPGRQVKLSGLFDNLDEVAETVTEMEYSPETVQEKKTTKRDTDSRLNVPVKDRAEGPIEEREKELADTREKGFEN